MNALATIKQNDEIEANKVLVGQARRFAMSPLVPQVLRNGGPEVAEANCFIALHLARAMGENPIVVMQNIHIVNGKAGFSAQYMIARANASGVFKGRINWRVEGKKDDLKVTALAVLAETGELVEATVDMAMAKAEGWTKNPKYQTMPEIMLRYRSATFLVRWFCPEVMLGYQTVDEVEDISYARLEQRPTVTAQDLIQQAQDHPSGTENPSVDNGEVVPVVGDPEASTTAGDEGGDDVQAVVAINIMAEYDAAGTIVDLNRVSERNNHNIQALRDDLKEAVINHGKARAEALKGGK